MARVLTDSWNMIIEGDLDPGSIRLGNSERLSLPSRRGGSKSKWPLGQNSEISIRRFLIDEKAAEYYVVITPYTGASDSAEKVAGMLVKRSAASTAAKNIVKHVFVGGAMVASIIGAVASLFIPADIASERLWNSTCSDPAPVYGATIGF